MQSWISPITLILRSNLPLPLSLKSRGDLKFQPIFFPLHNDTQAKF